jgi:hypothetical protein
MYWWLFGIPVIIALCMLAILFKPDIWGSDVDNEVHDFKQYIGQDGGDVLVHFQMIYPEYKKFEIIGPDTLTNNIVENCEDKSLIPITPSNGKSLKIHVSNTGKVRKIVLK